MTRLLHRRKDVARMGDASLLAIRNICIYMVEGTLSHQASLDAQSLTNSPSQAGTHEAGILQSSDPCSCNEQQTFALAAPEDLEEDVILCSSTSRYAVLQKTGEGRFGDVFKALNLATQEEVAVKFIYSKNESIEREVSILEAIGSLNPDSTTSIVKFYERFEHQGFTCLVFEMLDVSLHALVKENTQAPLSLYSIRPIAKQLLMALDTLSFVDILHADIKPDNILLVNNHQQPHRVKLIDFGLALPTTDVEIGMCVQTKSYRAPETILGLPITEAVDVWGVGCVLAFLYMAKNLFLRTAEYQTMKHMVNLLGQPADHLLDAGMYTQDFFIEDKDGDPRWRRMTLEEYQLANNKVPEEYRSFTDVFRSLEDLVYIYPREEDAEFKDREVFVDLLKRLLHIDWNQRIYAHEALHHPFITMDHLIERFDSSDYLATSQAIMNQCPEAVPPYHASSGASHITTDTYFEEVYPSPLLSEDVAPPSLEDKDPDACSSDEVVPLVLPARYPHQDASPISDDGDPDVHSSDGGLGQCSKDEHSAAMTSDGARPKDFSPDVSASSRRPKKILNRIQRFLRPVMTIFCDSKPPIVED